MLVNFRFGNHRSFYEETTFSMEATTDKDLIGLNTFSVDENLFNKNENTLLKSAVVFGGNASGKTNLIKAIAYMRNVVLGSGGQEPIVKMCEKFAFFTDAATEDSMFEVTFIEQGVLYTYGFSIGDGQITEEWLFRKKERLTPVFSRKAGRLKIAGTPNNIQQFINVQPTALLVSIGSNFNLPIKDSLGAVYGWFQKLLIVYGNMTNSLEIYTVNNEKYRKEALKILQRADIGISDMKVKKDRVVSNMHNIDEVLRFNTQLQTQLHGQLKQEENSLYDIDLRTTFDVYDKDGNVAKKKEVMLFKDRGFHSEGTERLVMYLGWLLAALDQGRVLFVDEIDSKLHFLMSDYLIGLFNSIDSNPHNAQLICTAHAVMLMDESLRRDQIYFVSKDTKGQSHLCALSDYKNVRKTDLFSKKYLAGFYSKLPDLNQGE